MLSSSKEAGGLTVVQDEAEAEYDGMPHSAIATGLIDFVPPVAGMPAKLLEVRDFAVDFALPEADRGKGENDAEILQKIFVQLRTRAGTTSAITSRTRSCGASPGACRCTRCRSTAPASRCCATRPLRVWVPGCATGEEAYSLAMLLSEACEDLDSRLRGNEDPDFHPTDPSKACLVRIRSAPVA